MKTSFTSLRPLRWLPLAGLALVALGCASDVEVGDAKPDDTAKEQEQNDDGVDDAETPTEAPVEPVATPEDEEVDCSEEDAYYRAPYEAWQALGNDFGVLAGKTLTGYIEAGPDLRLTIGTDNTATLVVGEAAPAPQKDNGYLCEREVEEYTACEIASSYPPVPGGSYPLHGATLEDRRLKFSLQEFSPWDDWCALQDPIEQEQENRCFFTLLSNAGFTLGPNYCSFDDQPVDCGWFALAQRGVCSCTSTECFAAIADHSLVATDPRVVLDARLNETEDELVGSLNGATVYLFVEAE